MKYQYNKQMLNLKSRYLMQQQMDKYNILLNLKFNYENA